MITSLSHGQIADAVVDAGLFHQTFYERQRSHRFRTVREALADFVADGARTGLSPHPLFSVPFYFRRNPDVRQQGINPLLHYLLTGWQHELDPHPLFDSRWYLAQVGRVSVNPLSHYLRYAARDRKSPNRLFDTQLYLELHPDIVRAGINPLEHYILYGRDEGRVPDRRLQAIVPAWGDGRLSLKRGAWKRPRTIWLAAPHAQRHGDAQALLEVARDLFERCRVDVRVLLDRDGPLKAEFEQFGRTICLDEFGQTTGDAELQPSTLRMLLFALIGDTREVTFWNPGACPSVVEAVADLGVAVSSATAATEDAGISVAVTPGSVPAARRIIVPCMDWSLSGVHTVAEALGRQLIDRGWDFRLLFTRGTIGVLDTGVTAPLPSIPYEFLDVSQCHTVREHCAAMIRYFERHAPCVVLCTFDDLANAVAPALTDLVGVVGWLQSDEPHYYESAYRLGRYWNSTVCVSAAIAERVRHLNPALASTLCCIHNSTVSRTEIVGEREYLEHGRLRLAYMGRLTQYQKRVLDLIPLVQELEHAMVPYRLTVIGSGCADDTERMLKGELSEQLATGKVRFTGRLGRADVFRELAHHDAFVLLSDFEGLPVSLTEAMACGCVPVVAPVESGIPEIVRHDENGLVIEGRDYATWAAALDDLRLDEGRLVRLSEAARRTVLRQLCSEQIADDFEVLFASILDDIQQRRYTRPPALTWRNPLEDVLLPPSMHGATLE